ncbi:peptidase, S8/S53 family [Bacteriovorax sp. BAL6_X]|uniref:S8 family serine peptidase n=1 Tax=Bacteriovorax sp. BAL6_X TaxID=1201290 RepID=UPI0003868033|nr:S8 family serine peptidase [Bacteriovorax sp. BAL6_X]EPZ49716.1 peptidase, S8/S53 family [Bacteriovorax sp. BAL6_X]
MKLKSFLLLSTLIASSFAFGAEKGQKLSFDQLRQRVFKKEYQKETSNTDVLRSRFSSWGIKNNFAQGSINLPGALKKLTTQKEVVVAVIDTGIDPTHPFLKDNIYVPKGDASITNFGLDFSKGASNVNTPYDKNRHGTHVSGIIKSVFPNVKILSLKYYNRHASGKDNLNSTIKALRYAVDLGVDIINYSGGGPEPDLEELEILKKAERKGIIVVAAAGNEQENIDNKKTAYFPASYKLSNIITVTAHDQSMKILNSSNWGAQTVDVSAPGYKINSAIPTSRNGLLTGTSQATAFVSGVAAMLKAGYPGLSAKQIKKIISITAKKEITFNGKVKSSGRVDATAAVELAEKLNTKTNGKLANYKGSKREVANTPKVIIRK